LKVGAQPELAPHVYHVRCQDQVRNLMFKTASNLLP
jgi:hypothetical protein